MKDATLPMSHDDSLRQISDNALMEVRKAEEDIKAHLSDLTEYYSGSPEREGNIRESLEAALLRVREAETILTDLTRSL